MIYYRIEQLLGKLPKSLVGTAAIVILTLQATSTVSAGDSRVSVSPPGVSVIAPYSPAIQYQGSSPAYRLPRVDR